MIIYRRHGVELMHSGLVPTYHIDKPPEHKSLWIDELEVEIPPDYHVEKSVGGDNKLYDKCGLVADIVDSSGSPAIVDKSNGKFKVIKLGVGDDSGVVRIDGHPCFVRKGKVIRAIVDTPDGAKVGYPYKRLAGGWVKVTSVTVHTLRMGLYRGNYEIREDDYNDDAIL